MTDVLNMPITADEAADKVIVALDCGRDEALRLAHELKGAARWVKVGMTLYYAQGPAIVSELRDLGYKVFVDLKFHDIPHQVRGAARAAAQAGASLLTAHALGGKAMLEAAHAGICEAANSEDERAKLLAITILTSMDKEALASVGVADELSSEVSRLAQLSADAASDGIVCSPAEAQAMRELLGPEALIVTPGVRPAGAAVGDQRRIATPSRALAAGASHLVIGRPITEALHPLAAFESIIDELCAR